MYGKTFEEAWESLDAFAQSLPTHLLSGGYLENLMQRGFTRHEETLQKQMTMYDTALERWWSAHLHFSNFCYGDGSGWGNIKQNPLSWFGRSTTFQEWPLMWERKMKVYLEQVYGYQRLNKDHSLSKPHVLHGFTPSMQHRSADKQELANFVIPDTRTGNALFTLLERVAKPSEYSTHHVMSGQNWPDLPNTEGGGSYTDIHNRMVIWINSLQFAWYHSYVVQISNIATAILLNESQKQRAAKRASKSWLLRW